MATLKANPGTGTLRANDYLDVDGVTSIYGLTDSCTCCELDVLYDWLPEGLVDTGETQTITASGTAHFPGFWFQDESAIRPQAYFSAGGVATAYVTLFRQGTLDMSGIPGTWDVDGSGFNATPVIACEAAFSGVDTNQYYQIALEPDPPGVITFSASFPARLFAGIRDFGRFNSDGSMWGPRPNDEADALDLRGYKSARLDWMYWGRDGDGGSISVSAFGHTFSTVSGGPDLLPMPVAAGAAELRAASLQEQVGPAWLEFEFWGSPVFPDYYNEEWDIAEPAENSSGVKAWTSGRKCYIEALGDIPSARNGQIVFANIQPDRRLHVTSDVVNGGGVAWDSETWAINNLDGPDVVAWGYGTTDVNTEYPIGTALSAAAPGTIDRTGTAHSVNALCWLALDTDTGVLEEEVDTIGTPAFGFAYDITDLESTGQNADAWRFPLRIPAASASWPAVRCRVLSPTFPAATWTADPETDTTVTVTSGESHVEGTTPTVTQTLPAAFSAGTSRFVLIRLKGSVTFAVGTKEWAIDTGGEYQNVMLDLCCPTNATDDDRTTTKIQAATSAGWAWGIEGTPEMTITSAAEFWISTFKPLHNAWGGLLYVNEAVIDEDSRFFLETITVGADDIDIYAHRGLLWAPEGRVALDLPFGSVGVGYSTGDAERVYERHSIGEVVGLAATATGGHGLYRLDNLKPSSTQLWTGWDGAFKWYDWSHYFTSAVEAYHLRPGVSIENGSVNVYADYCVDRVVPGVGVSGTYTSRKVIGGGIHGITANAANAADSMGVNTDENDDRAVSLAHNGLFVLPVSEQTEDGDTYTVIPDAGVFEDDPVVTVVDGISERVGVIHGG